MKCPNCGSEVKDNMVFCSNCGSRINRHVNSIQSNQPVPNQETNTQIQNQPVPNQETNTQIQNQPVSNQEINPQTLNKSQVTNENIITNQPISNTPIIPQSENPSNTNKPSHKKPWPIIILIIIIIIAILTVSSILKVNDTHKDNKEKTNTEIENNINNQETTTENNTNNTENENSNIVTYSGFNFKIPKELDATPSEEGLLITDKDINIIVVIKYFNNQKYSDYSRMKNSIISVLKQAAVQNNKPLDFTNATTIESNYNGTKFLITKDAKMNGVPTDMTYAEANNGVFVITIGKQNGEITDSDRTLYYTIVANANN